MAGAGSSSRGALGGGGLGRLARAGGGAGGRRGAGGGGTPAGGARPGRRSGEGAQGAGGGAPRAAAPGDGPRAGSVGGFGEHLLDRRREHGPPAVLPDRLGDRPRVARGAGAVGTVDGRPREAGA